MQLKNTNRWPPPLVNAVVPNLGVNYPRRVIDDSSVGNVTALSKIYA